MTAARKRSHLRVLPQDQPKRVAVYTRKSTTKGLDAAFTSLDSQRESILAYITSQTHQGWTAIEEAYDDGGFSGGTTDRPAFQRLLEDVRAGRIDVVACYKIDRISRSLPDFTNIMAEFEKHGVALVSITESFDTSSPMGRMTLNLLATFAQFEREMISERTRDKMAATRRKGMWAGGTPPHGFRAVDQKLVPDPEFAEQVPEMFREYLRIGTLKGLAGEFHRRGWRTRRGCKWTKGSIGNILTNPVYIGKIRFEDEVYEGKHDGIVDPDLFDSVQRQLEENGRQGGAKTRNKWKVLLRGILKCGACRQPMVHTYAKRNQKLFHYYRCRSHDVAGDKCPDATANTHGLDSFVVQQIAGLGRNPEVLAATVAAVRDEAIDAAKAQENERKTLSAQHGRNAAKLRKLVGKLTDSTSNDSAVTAQVAELSAASLSIDERIKEIDQGPRASIRALTEDSIRFMLADFAATWEALKFREQRRLVQLLVSEIRFFGEAGDVEIDYHDEGLVTLIKEGSK